MANKWINSAAPGNKDRADRLVKLTGEMQGKLTKLRELLSDPDRKVKVAQRKFVSTSRVYKMDHVVDAEDALDLLLSAAYNRDVTDNKVTRYVLDYVNGAWGHCPEPIRINKKGHVVDSNHRLYMVYVLDEPMTFDLELGFPDEAVLRIDDRASARSAKAASGYFTEDGEPLDEAVSLGIKTILGAFNVPDYRHSNGRETPFWRFYETYRDEIHRVLEALPKKSVSQAVPSYRKGELFAALLTCCIVNESSYDALVEPIREINLGTPMFRWLKDYLGGLAVKNCRNNSDYTNRYKAYLWLLINRKVPVPNGANGMDNANFTTAFVEKVFDDASVDLCNLTNADRQLTSWNSNKDFIPKKPANR